MYKHKPNLCLLCFWQFYSFKISVLVGGGLGGACVWWEDVLKLDVWWGRGTKVGCIKYAIILWLRSLIPFCFPFFFVKCNEHNPLVVILIRNVWQKIKRNIFVMCRNLCLESCFFLFLAWNRARQLLLLCSHLVWFQISMGLVVSFHIFILGILCSFSWFVKFDCLLSLLWSRPCCWFL